MYLTDINPNNMMIEKEITKDKKDNSIAVIDYRGHIFEGQSNYLYNK